MTKICTKCKQEKAVDHFNRDKNREDGFTQRCRLCAREQDKKNHIGVPNEGQWGHQR